MSFSSFNGDVDVSLPASLKAKVKIKTTMGEIFTDFDLTEIENPERVTHKPRRNSDGRYKVKVDRAFWGAIGDGDQVMEFSSFNGDIFIRKN